MGYKIVEAQEPVAVFGGHNYWVLLDDNNNKLSELHGFQVDASGNISTTGSGGTLQVFSNYTMGYNASTTQQVVYTGNVADVVSRWNAALDCGTQITQSNYSYNLFDSSGGHNSNAAASTLGTCMAVSEANLGSLTPGKGDIILPTNVISDIQTRYSVGDAGCVAISSLLPGGKTAGDIRIGDVMELADERDLTPATGEVSYSEEKYRPGYRIVTNKGATLLCSDSAPIPTPDGLVLAPELLGKKVAVRRDGLEGTSVGWEEIVEVQSIGMIAVRHITVGNKCFWAGEKKSTFILHHNLKAAPGSGGGGGGDPGDDFFMVPNAHNNIESSASSLNHLSVTTAADGHVEIVGLPAHLIYI